MKITLSNSEYNFIKKVLKKNVNNIFTNNFKTFLNNELYLNKYNNIPNYNNRILKIKSILKKLDNIKRS